MHTCPQCYRQLDDRYDQHECNEQPARVRETTEAEQQEISRLMTTPGALTNRTHCPPPGIYHDVPFDEYLQWPAVSQSTLKTALVSAAHYRHALDNPPDPDKECFQFGRLCHSGKLEPLEALRRYVVMPDLTEGLTNDDGKPYKNPRASNAYKAKVEEFRRVNADKEIVSQEWFEQVCGMIEQLNRHRLAKQWLSSDEPAEVSLVWREPLTGLTCKGRIDKLTDNRIVDLKTTSRPVAEFERDLANFGYDLQAAFYLDGLAILAGEYSHSFGIVAVERNAPYAVRAAELDPDTIAAGRAKYRRALRTVAECRESNRWPGPADPLTWTLPKYSQPAVDLTTGGHPITIGG